MSDEVTTPEVAPAEVDAGADPKAAGGDQKAPVETTAERKFRLKFGSEERELTEQQLIAQAQKGWAADKRFEEASRSRKELERVAKEADIDELVRRLKGKDPKEFYKERLKEELRLMTMTPEQKAMHDQRKELEQLKSEAEQLKQARENEKMAKLEAHYSAQYDKDLTEAINKNGLPKNRVAIKRAVDLASKVVAMGLDPDWDLVVKEAKRGMLEDMKELFGAYTKDEDLLELLGEDLPKRLGNAMSKRAKVVGKAQPRVEGKVDRDEPAKKTVDMAQWMKDQRKKFEEG